MRQRLDARFRAQSEAHALRFTCEHCAHFNATTELCEYGFPTEEHRDAFYRPGATVLVFCKNFELA